MEERLCCIWLSLLFSPGSNQPNRILTACGSASEFYRMTDEERAALGFLRDRDLETARRTSIKRAEKIVRQCEEKRIRIVAWCDDEYPKRLRLIYGPPAVLYVLGSLEGLDEEPAITIVGTRRPSEYSIRVTEWLSQELVEAGAVIVSGCAVGIDAAAHRGALHGKGRTIGVLACGMDIDYPAENHRLKAAILRQGGTLVTELPPGTRTAARYFPVRNRLLSGLSCGVLVTQAPLRSGSLITANHAVEQGKDVFCVPPADLFDPSFAGVIRYLRDGAIPVFCADDVLQMYTGTYAHRLDLSHMRGDYVQRMEAASVKPPVQKSDPEGSERQEPLDAPVPETQEAQFPEEDLTGLEGTQRMLLECLGRTPKGLDELAEQSNLSIGELLSILTELEILGLAQAHGGQRFSRKARSK